MHPTGANYKAMHKHIERLNLNVAHFKGQGYLKGKTHNWSKKIPLEDILVEHSTYTNTSLLKSRLIKAGMLKNVCSICKQKPMWLGKPLLDHKNGINDDHRKVNLRLLCPNCNSQQETFAGRNKNSGRGGNRTRTPI